MPAIPIKRSNKCDQCGSQIVLGQAWTKLTIGDPEDIAIGETIMVVHAPCVRAALASLTGQQQKSGNSDVSDLEEDFEYGYEFRG